MFSDDKNIESIQELFTEHVKYIKLQTEYTKLELVEKLSVLFSTLIMVSVFIMLGVIVIFYLSFSFAYVLEPLVGGLKSSYAIISGFILLLIVVIAILRKRLIINPMVRFLANKYINNPDK